MLALVVMVLATDGTVVVKPLARLYPNQAECSAAERSEHVSFSKSGDVVKLVVTRCVPTEFTNQPLKR